MVKTSTAPNDKEQRAPMTAVEMDTNRAAFFRVITNSSWKKAVLTSCNDISDVSAARVNNRKNSREIM
jgi:hypothetical protein